MKVVHVALDDGNGGASRGVQRLIEGQRKIGLDAMMFVQAKSSLADHVIAKPAGRSGRWGRMIARELDSLPKKFCGGRNYDWMIGPLGMLPTRSVRQIQSYRPDVVHLHHVGSGLLSLRDVSRFDAPVFMTCHDFWPVSALYHYEPIDNRVLGTDYRDHRSRKWFERRLARWQFNRKLKAWDRAQIRYVAPSRWMADVTKESRLAQGRPVEVIPYGLDFDKFQMVDRNEVRKLLALPTDRPLLLYGAHNATRDGRKGYRPLCEALQILKDRGADFDLVVLGAKEPLPIDGVTCHLRTLVADEVTMVAYYNAVNATVMPSIQETFGQMGSESIACGTPAAAFQATGAADVIDHEQTGHYAVPYQSESLAEAIEKSLLMGMDDEGRAEIRDGITKRLSQTHVAQQHLDYYQRAIRP